MLNQLSKRQQRNLIVVILLAVGIKAIFINSSFYHTLASTERVTLDILVTSLIVISPFIWKKVNALMIG